MAQKFRGWCFTLNNYSEFDIDTLAKVDCVYIVYGIEVGKEFTSHLQGYIYFKN